MSEGCSAQCHPVVPAVLPAVLPDFCRGEGTCPVGTTCTWTFGGGTAISTGAHDTTAATLYTLDYSWP